MSLIKIKTTFPCLESQVLITDIFIFYSLFIDVSKIDKAVSKHLELDSANDNSETKVTVCPYDGIWDAVNETAGNGARIWVLYNVFF